jgi:hypothetical protein
LVKIGLLPLNPEKKVRDSVIGGTICSENPFFKTRLVTFLGMLLFRKNT